MDITDIDEECAQQLHALEVVSLSNNYINSLTNLHSWTQLLEVIELYFRRGNTEESWI